MQGATSRPTELSPGGRLARRHRAGGYALVIALAVLVALPPAARGRAVAGTSPTLTPTATAIASTPTPASGVPVVRAFIDAYNHHNLNGAMRLIGDHLIGAYGDCDWTWHEDVLIRTKAHVRGWLRTRFEEHDQFTNVVFIPQRPHSLRVVGLRMIRTSDVLRAQGIAHVTWPKFILNPALTRIVRVPIDVGVDDCTHHRFPPGPSVERTKTVTVTFLDAYVAQNLGRLAQTLVPGVVYRDCVSAQRPITVRGRSRVRAWLHSLWRDGARVGQTTVTVPRGGPPWIARISALWSGLGFSGLIKMRVVMASPNRGRAGSTAPHVSVDKAGAESGPSRRGSSSAWLPKERKVRDSEGPCLRPLTRIALQRVSAELSLHTASSHPYAFRFDLADPPYQNGDTEQPASVRRLTDGSSRSRRTTSGWKLGPLGYLLRGEQRAAATFRRDYAPAIDTELALREPKISAIHRAGPHTMRPHFFCVVESRDRKQAGEEAWHKRTISAIRASESTAS